MAEHPTLQRIMVAAGIFLAAVATALPDGEALSPRAIALAVAMGLIGAGVYLGAPRPESPLPEE